MNFFTAHRRDFHCGSNRGSIVAPIVDDAKPQIIHKAKRGATKRSEEPQSEARSHNRNGFTLIEAIIYIAIASMFFAASVGFFWQMHKAEIKSDTQREVKENVSQAVESFKYFTRNSQGVDAGGSQFGINPGVLVLTYPDGGIVFDTYTKNIFVGGNQAQIHKLRYTQNGNSYDISSDHVDVTEYKLSDLNPGAGPEAFQMELTISSINPTGNPDYKNSLSVRTTVNIRKEI